MKRRFLFTFGSVGFFLAIILLVVRLYLVNHNPDYGAWFDIFTVILWPGAFYLFVLQSSEPPKVVFFVCSVAVLLNVAIYTLIGWLIWSIARRLAPPHPKQQ